MKSNDPLFALIHSLTNSEKRYFKLNAEYRKGEKKYLVLFDAIAGQNKYDEQELRRALKGERFLNELHVAKHYLFEQILKSLRSYFGERTAYQKILRYAQEIDILNRRGLHSLALKRIGKMKELAKKYHHLSLWLHAVEREQIYFANSIVGAKEASYLDKEMEYLLDQISQKKNFDEIAFASVDALYVTSANKKRISELEKKILSMQREFEPNGSDTRTLLSFNRMNSRFFLLQNQPEKALPYLKAMVDILDANPLMVQEGYFNQYVVLNGYYSCLYHLSFEPAKEFFKSSVMRAFIRKMEASVDPKNGEDHMVRLMNCVMDIQSSWCIFMGEYELGLRLLLESRKKFKKITSETTVYAEVSYSYYFCRFYFGLGDYTSALEWVNKLINAPVAKTNTSLMGCARMIQLVILFELDEYEHISRQLKPLIMYQKKHKHYLQYETLALKTLRSLIAMQKNKYSSAALEGIHNQFTLLRNSKAEAGRFLEFEFDWWLEAKVRGMPYADIVRMHRASEKKRH